MRRSTICKLICENVEDLFVLSARGYRSVVFFRDRTIFIINDDDEDDNMEAPLVVLTTHIKKECSVMEYKRRTYPTKIAREIAEESAPVQW